MEARGARDHRHAMLRQIRGDGGEPVASVAPRVVPGNSGAYIHCFRLRASDSIHAIGVGVIKDPKLFKRLDRNMKKTGGKRGLDHRRTGGRPSVFSNPNDGTKYFPVAQTTTVSHTQTARQSRLLFRCVWAKAH